jgi:putative C-S lyase
MNTTEQKYDFTSLPDRKGTGSVKYAEMREAVPEVPEDIVPLSVADMEFKTAPELTGELLEYLKDLVFGYSHPTPAYYAALFGWLKKRHNWAVKKDWVVTTEGVVTALFNAVAAFTGPGDSVIIMPPVYHPFYLAVERNNRCLVENNLVIRDGRYRIDFDDLEKKARDPRTKLLLFCSPHNPVGRVWEQEELERVGQICLENNVVIISDEIHFDLVMPGHTHRIFAALNGTFADNVVVCSAPSKTFNLAGLHGSNIIIKNEGLRNKFRETLGRRKSAFPSLNILAYKACEIAYTRCENWLEQLLAVLDYNRHFAEDFIKSRLPAIKVFPLEGTYLQWWDCRELGMDHKELEHFMRHEAFLFLNEGYIFGGCGKGFERINLACPSRVLEAALARLESALKRRSGGHA